MTRSFFLLVAGAIAIGFAPIFLRLASTGPISTAFWRMALAVPVLWMFVRQQNDASSALVAFRSSLVWLAGLAFALDLATWHFSIRLTSVTNATLLANCAVLLVPLFSWVFLRRPVGSRTLGCGLLAFFGMVLLSSPSLRTGSARLLGDALAVLTAGFSASPPRHVRGSGTRYGVVARFRKLVVEHSHAAPDRALGRRRTASLRGLGLGVAHRAGSDLASLRQTAIAHALGRIPPAQAAVGLLRSTRLHPLFSPGSCFANRCPVFSSLAARWFSPPSPRCACLSARSPSRINGLVRTLRLRRRHEDGIALFGRL